MSIQKTLATTATRQQGRTHRPPASPHPAVAWDQQPTLEEKKVAQYDSAGIIEELTFDEIARSLGYVKAEEAMPLPEPTPTVSDELARMRPMVGPKQAAEALGISERAVVGMIHSGRLSAVRMGKLWRISRDEVMRAAGVA